MGDIAIQFVRSALATAAPDDVRRLLDGVPPRSARVPVGKASELARSVWALTGDELFGLGPRPVPLGTFRMIAMGVVHAPDLRTALERAVAFASITTGFTRTGLVVAGGTCRVEFAADEGVVEEPFALELVLAFAHRFLAWLTGQRIVLSHLDLPFAEPGHSAEYERIFGVAASFHAPVAAFGFDARYLDAPVVRDEPALEAFLRDSPMDLIEHRDHGDTTADRVRKVLERGEPGPAARSADDVAARLAISAQHMRRLLRREGTSFHEIREDVLRAIAVAGLESGRESVDGLSRRLGFSEPSAFRRAFARWVGIPPGEYRRQALDRRRRAPVVTTAPATHSQANRSPTTR
ncbi:AraC family transcriptional regulator [Umezawaea tangerina]|uniref:AraC family transcriptional regulator n=1 Tax=Umezawaea tangerina TaxID=84725 RepID=A0A2T0SZA7_9PSEU|nr:AraC family transcriptional regulator [Umezawaea tangerina]PRY38693.1 AraC family transcriptional regulator [Umezawaea tangerina]